MSAKKKLNRYKASFWDLALEEAQLEPPVPDTRPIRKVAELEDEWICWVCEKPCTSMRIQDDEPSHVKCIQKLAREKGKVGGRYRGNDPKVFAYLRECEPLQKGDS